MLNLFRTLIFKKIEIRNLTVALVLYSLTGINMIAQTVTLTGHVTDLKQALTGQLPDVITVTTSGEPGGTGQGNSATNIYIRGQNT